VGSQDCLDEVWYRQGDRLSLQFPNHMRQFLDWRIGDVAAVRQALPFCILDTLASDSLAKLIQKPRFPHHRLPSRFTTCLWPLFTCSRTPSSSSSPRARPTKEFWVKLRRPGHVLLPGLSPITAYPSMRVGALIRVQWPWAFLQDHPGVHQTPYRRSDQKLPRGRLPKQPHQQHQSITYRQQPRRRARRLVVHPYGSQVHG
jgi:hypothetical protein